MLRKIKFYIALIIFIFVIPHEINEINLLWLKLFLVVLFFVAPVLSIVNKAGEKIEKPINKFKEFDSWKKDKGRF